ncbi:hypothetical protein EVAR_64367_1 [Eumeta japonica]|uniref:Uncharacterized protein n=1 Tax=Eumeta variegata TaxID=151549 RepID=A0A4C2A1I6_EUMVA|nr:hypothetical protein EVAR_64367_1 [Eumeta japonica]
MKPIRKAGEYDQNERKNKLRSIRVREVGGGHMMRSKKKKWTKGVTVWCPRDEKKRIGSQKIRWEDDMKKVAGITWQRNAKNKKTWKTLGEAYAKGQADNVTDV